MILYLRLLIVRNKAWAFGNMTSQVLAIFYLNDMNLNKKSRIYKNTNNFVFLGRNTKGKYARYRTVNRKLKKRRYLYESGKINLMSYVTSKICYKNL